jgi:hypothetical protein
MYRYGTRTIFTCRGVREGTDRFPPLTVVHVHAHAQWRKCRKVAVAIG